MRSVLQIATDVPLETQEQQALFAWAALQTTKYPELELLFAVPNGAYKSKAMAAKFQREGLKAGVPDVILPVARGGFHALFIEMKRQRRAGTRKEQLAGKRPGKDQLAWHERLRKQGNAVAVAYGWEEARDLLIDYITEHRLYRRLADMNPANEEPPAT